MQISSDMDSSRYVEPKRIDIMLVPGLAFDKHGNRLGQGGGFYDRYLPYVRQDCLTLGIALDEQVIESVPHGTNDQRVDYIVTPTRVISAEK